MVHACCAHGGAPAGGQEPAAQEEHAAPADAA
jgi:hypothetical protein